MRNQFILAGVAATFAYVAPAFSEECSAALTKDISFRQFSNDEQIAIFFSMDMSHFASSQEDASAKGGFTIDGVPITFGGDWKKLQSAQDDMKKKYSVKYKNSSNKTFFDSRLSLASANAYIACIQATTNQAGLFLQLKKIQGDSVVVGVIFKTVPTDQVLKNIIVNPGKDAILTPGQKSEFGPITNLSQPQDVTILRINQTSNLDISAYVEDAETKKIFQQTNLNPIPPDPTLFARKSHLIHTEKYVTVNARLLINQIASSTQCIPTSTNNFIKDVNWRDLDPRTAGLGNSWSFAKVPSFDQNPSDATAREYPLGKSVCGTLTCQVTVQGDNCSYTGWIEGNEDVFDGWQRK